jgi:hypothetical protein
LPELDSFLENVHTFEVFLQDKCPLPKFDLRDHLHPERIEGSFRGSGEALAMVGVAHPDNYTRLFDGRQISKMAFGTQGMMDGLQGDFF